MRFTSFIVAGVFALAANAQSSSPSSTTEAAPQVTDKVTKCLDACDPADVTCKANCITVPSPDNSNVNATTECVADCDQGKGTAADNEAYGQCVQTCIDQNFYTSGGLNPTGTTGGSGSTPTPTMTTTFTSDGQTYTSTSAPQETGGNGNGGNGGSDSDSQTDGDDQDGAAGMVTVGSSVGLLALFAGMLAL